MRSPTADATAFYRRRCCTRVRVTVRRRRPLRSTTRPAGSVAVVELAVAAPAAGSDRVPGDAESAGESVPAVGRAREATVREASVGVAERVPAGPVPVDSAALVAPAVAARAALVAWEVQVVAPAAPATTRPNEQPKHLRSQPSRPRPARPRRSRLPLSRPRPTRPRRRPPSPPGPRARRRRFRGVGFGGVGLGDSGSGDCGSGDGSSGAGERLGPAFRIAALPATLAHHLERPEGGGVGPRRPDEVDPHHRQGDPERHEDSDEHDDGDHRRRQHGANAGIDAGTSPIFARSADELPTRRRLEEVPDRARSGHNRRRVRTRVVRRGRSDRDHRSLWRPVLPLVAHRAALGVEGSVSLPDGRPGARRAWSPDRSKARRARAHRRGQRCPARQSTVAAAPELRRVDRQVEIRGGPGSQRLRTAARFADGRRRVPSVTRSAAQQGRPPSRRPPRAHRRRSDGATAARSVPFRLGNAAGRYGSFRQSRKSATGSANRSRLMRKASWPCGESISA